MTDFFEIDENKKTISILNLDDFSVEDLEKYLEELNQEMTRVNLEIRKKISIKDQANKMFK